MKVNFITNQSLNNISGGWSGISFNIYNQLNRKFSTYYNGPINPPMIYSEKLVSKLLRLVGLRGNFAFYSDKRLRKINESIKEYYDSDYNFFFGQTPWISYNSPKKYGVYMDADFLTYLDIYSNLSDFKPKDINRIVKMEEAWLQNAEHIFVGSQWTWDRMSESYDLEEDKKIILYTGGNIDLPKEDKYNGSLDLVFISLDFEKKGGYICVEAFMKVKETFPSLRLIILGQRPPQEIIELDGIMYGGFLRKNNPDELNKFIGILENAFLLVHPTKMDTMGAVLIEAGYFGCPSIAPARFGIPELVINNLSGYVIQSPFTALDFAGKIKYLLSNEEIYFKMRQNAWNHTRSNLTWDIIGNKIYNTIIR